ncbi:MAG: CpXC domain-containing protein [Kofleriaceae bacterium]
MSTFASARIRCHCGVEQEVELAEGLHISARPDIRQQILDGTFHRFTCPACKGSIQIETLLAYTDFPNHHWFTIVPEEELPWRGERVAFAKLAFQRNMVERAAPIVQHEMAPRMKQRVIFGLAALREKIICFDAGLDDRLVEALKLQLLRDLGLTFASGGYFHLVEVTGLEHKIENAPDGTERDKQKPEPRGQLDELATDCAHIEAALPELWNDIVVDYRVMLVPDAARA